MTISKRFESLAFVLIFIIGWAPPSNAAPGNSWDDTDIKYGTDNPSRQWLNIHLADSSAQPAPVYLYAHGAGESANDMTEKQLHTIASKGYTTVSWNSLAVIGSNADLSVTWSDAQQAFDWVQANAATYNFDPDHIVIGGVSSGSGASWELAHSGHPAIKGIYMVNALPNGFWQDTASWSPVDNVTVNSPPTYLVYGPTPAEIDAHTPTNVAPVVDRYEALNIADRMTLIDGMWNDFQDANGNWTNDGENMHYFPQFVDSLNVKVSRTTDQITLVDSKTVTLDSNSWELNYYQDDAYDCGLTGKFSFMVMEPANNPGVEAPLWVYLHGGGYGWFEEDGFYQAVKTQTEHSWNHQETFQDFIDKHLLHNTTRADGEVQSSTLTRRIQEGYRVVFGSLCDHDLYSGRGAPYANNPNPHGQVNEVNGLQAAMAAVDYTVANYPSTQVFAHGTSAGSIGVFSMAQAYLEEGIKLTAIVADSWTITPRVYEMFDMLVGQPPYVFNGGSLLIDGMEKIGFDYVGLGIYPDAKISAGFTEVPSMIIIGELDPACGGGNPTIPQAQAAGLSNCGWMYDDLRKAVDNQPNSPHVFDLSPTGNHVDTNRKGPLNDRVDTFLNGVLSKNPPQVFPSISQ